MKFTAAKLPAKEQKHILTVVQLQFVEDIVSIRDIKAKIVM